MFGGGLAAWWSLRKCDWNGAEGSSITLTRPYCKHAAHTHKLAVHAHNLHRWDPGSLPFFVCHLLRYAMPLNLCICPPPRSLSSLTLLTLLLVRPNRGAPAQGNPTDRRAEDLCSTAWSLAILEVREWTCRA